jgi:hypothetical protein
MLMMQYNIYRARSRTRSVRSPTVARVVGRDHEADQAVDRSECDTQAPRRVVRLRLAQRPYA